jgi:hypothetical protein
MARFLIEVPHDEEIVACANAVEIFLKTGNHFLTHADWGCKDGVHKAWIVVDVDSKDEARTILPQAYRKDASIIQLNKFTLAEIEELLKQHKGQRDN